MGRETQEVDAASALGRSKLEQVMRLRPSPSMVVSLLALFVAASGTSIAANAAKRNPVPIPPRSIGAAQLKINAVTSKAIRTAAITFKDIGRGAVGTRTLAPNAVTTASIAPGSITAPTLAPAAITQAALADFAVGASKLGDNSVGSAKLRGEAVTNEKLGPFAVQAPNVALGAINAAKLAEQAVTAAKLSAGSVTAPAIADDAVGTPQLDEGAVGTDQISSAVPAVGASATGTQTIPHGTRTVIALNAERFDTRNMHSVSVDNGKVFIPEDGVYLLTGAIEWERQLSPMVGEMFLGIARNSAGAIAYDGRSIDTNTARVQVFTQLVSTAAVLEAGDYLELEIYQYAKSFPGESPISLDSVAGFNAPELTAVWIAPGPA